MVSSESKASGNSSFSVIGPRGLAVMERDRAAKEDVGIPNKYNFLFLKKKTQNLTIHALWPWFVLMMTSNHKRDEDKHSVMNI